MEILLGSIIVALLINYITKQPEALSRVFGCLVITIIYIAGFPIFMLLNYWQLLKRFNKTYKKG
jgi:hypothetical protein